MPRTVKRQKVKTKKTAPKQTKAPKKKKAPKEPENTKEKSSKSSKSSKKNKGNKLPQTISDSIPYEYVYENGIIEVRPGVFSQSYRIPPANFKTASDDAQFQMAEAYSTFLNSFDPGVDVEITLYNRTIDEETFKQKVFLPMKDDQLNEYREEYNRMLAGKMTGAKNNLETDKILTVSLEATDIVAANEAFAQINGMVNDNMVSMTKYGCDPMTLVERLDILNEIMKGDRAKPVYEERMIDGRKSISFSLENCARQGITTKEVIAPDSMEFKTNQMRIGDRFARSYYVSVYPTYIKGTILTDFASLPANVLVSVYFNSMEQSAAIRMLKQQGVNINAEVVNAERTASRNGAYGDAAVGTTLSNAQAEVKELTEMMTKDNTKLFLVTFVFTLFADTEEELKHYEDQLYMIGNKNLLTIQALNFQHESGFAASLPLGNNKVPIQRLMTSQTVASIIPFDVKEIRQDGGMYYGQNAVSQNMILYNRTSDVNPNACILGMPGAGKSFAAKREIINVLLNTDDEVYIIDPQGEYRPLTDAFHGTSIRIAMGSSVHLNPFDMNINNADESGDPIKIKTDYIETITEIMAGTKWGLSPVEKSIIGRCAQNIYQDYIIYLQRTGKTQDLQRTPTMHDFHSALCMQPQPEAQTLALGIEQYVSGAYDTFSYHTNINTDNRFVVYDIKDIGSGLKNLGLQIALDNVWNKMVENYLLGKRTWIYVDEAHLLLQSPTSASYIAQIWKMARKWRGSPCFITQNVEDMLSTPDARTIINNSSFILMLGQAPINRQQLSEMMNISPSEQKYISSAKPGMGILHIGESNIPMDDSFPKDTKLYEIMTTNPDE